METKKYPHKYRNLLELSPALNVPPVTILDNHALIDIYPLLEKVYSDILEVVDNMIFTSGSCFERDCESIDKILNRLSSEPANTSALADILGENFGESWQEQNFAVRSASFSEDSSRDSLAGVYESFLNVAGPDNLSSAIVSVIRSKFAKPVLLKALREGSSSYIGEMNVMIQRMVDSQVSGVAFSCSPLDGSEGVPIEFVSGLGDKLVSGAQDASRFSMQHAHDVPHDYQDLSDMFSELYSAVHVARNKLGYDVDVEWAYDGDRLYILQARQVTTVSKESAVGTSEAILMVGDIYGDADLDGEFRMPSFAEYFRKKRKPLMDCAKRLGLGVGEAVICRYNKNALKRGAMDSFFARFSGAKVVVDFDHGIRQMIVASSELRDVLDETALPDGQPSTVVVRDFIKGQAGLITHSVKNDGSESVLCEYSECGLMAINRGHADTVTFNLSEPTPDAVNLSESDKERLIECTTKIGDDIRGAQIEWVYEGGQLYPVDYSIVDKSDISTSGAMTVVSHGFTQGKPILIDNDELLTNLSIAPIVDAASLPEGEDMGRHMAELLSMIRAQAKPPIVLADKPYAALAVLIPYVSGFVFKSSSVLCHLAILLREHSVPAVSIGDGIGDLMSFDSITIQTESETMVCGH